jgi:hypothetical protein
MRSIGEYVDMGLDVATAETGGAAFAALGAVVLGVGALGVVTATLQPSRYKLAAGIHVDPSDRANHYDGRLGVEWVISPENLEELSLPQLSILVDDLYALETDLSAEAPHTGDLRPLNQVYCARRLAAQMRDDKRRDVATGRYE